ncbi:hypothetical protein BBJ28_00003118 [Nothophytophthora sp. Chile5]|nr:hypothetical protein BBJ28_00003118 [Nothophytophthora sp. Chile5]
MESGGVNSPVQAPAPPLISAGPSLSSVDQRSRPHLEAKSEVLGAPREAEDNNQEDGGVQSPLAHYAGALVGQDSTIWTPQHGEQQLKSDNNELQRLRKENAALLHRLKHLETQHDQSVADLQMQLQQTAEAHREAEHRLNTQLKRLRSEQQAAVDNARKMRAVLARVSNWVHQLQRVARQPPQLPRAASREQDLELSMAPRDVPSISQAESASPHHAFPIPPPAPGRYRAQSVPNKGFSRAVSRNRCVSVVSPDLAIGGPVLASIAVNDESEAAPSNNTPTTKGSATGLLAYCAQLVTTSLSASLSSPSPNSKVIPAWKLDHFSPVREPEFDQELGQWCGEQSKERREINVALPNLALGLL